MGQYFVEGFKVYHFFNLKKLPIDDGIANNLSLNQCDHEFIVDLWGLDYGGD
jgi:hypothetical protein